MILHLATLCYNRVGARQPSSAEHEVTASEAIHALVHRSMNSSSQFMFKLSFTGEDGPPEEGAGTGRRAEGTNSSTDG